MPFTSLQSDRFLIHSTAHLWVRDSLISTLCHCLKLKCIETCWNATVETSWKCQLLRLWLDRMQVFPPVGRARTLAVMWKEGQLITPADLSTFPAGGQWSQITTQIPKKNLLTLCETQTKTDCNHLQTNCVYWLGFHEGTSPVSHRLYTAISKLAAQELQPNFPNTNTQARQ